MDAASVDEAIQWLGRYKGRVKLMAGGIDVLSLLKAGVDDAELLVNIKRIPSMSYIHDDGEGLRVGALTKLSDVAGSGVVAERFTALAQAAARVATPQIRSMATVGGNLMQQPWCWYLRSRYQCWLNGGRFCYAATGDNRNYFSVLGGRRCIAAHPSDVATALFALDAKVRVVGPRGERIMTVQELLPGATVVEGRVQTHGLRGDEMLIELLVPDPKPDTKSVFVKFSLRESWDFALASAAASVTWGDGAVQEARIALGGVATSPRRCVRAERLLKGKDIDEAVCEEAARLALDGAKPLSMNAYKVDVAKALVKRALMTLGNSR